MRLIDLPLSEVVVVSEVIDNMSHCGGARCVFRSWDFRIIIAAAVCSSDIAVVVVFVAT